VELIAALAWPLVALVAIGASLWAFNVWRHPTIAEETLKGALEKLLDQEKRIGNIELARGHEERRQGVLKR